MTDEKSLKRLNELTALYKYRWGREIDLSLQIKGLTMEKLILVLERITEYW